MFINFLFKLLSKVSFKFYYRLKAKSQNDNKEAIELLKISKKAKINKSFIEFGFHPYELNSHIFLRKNFQGLLIDANDKTCENMDLIIKKLKVDSKTNKHFISLEKLAPISNFINELNNDLGLLSIDIDGNDYWILKKILTFTKPHLICIEHNASFGTKNISTPYIEMFDRHKLHKSGLYHGGSITAFYSLLQENYDLIMNVEGLNLIFLRKDKNPGLSPLNPIEAYKECTLRNLWSNTTAKEQWKIIQNLEYENLN